jgi:hypothetical protein
MNTEIPIKLALYRFYMQHQFDSRATAEQQKLYLCVRAVSYAEAEKYQLKCADNRACFENIPAMTKESITAKIDESKKLKIENVSDSCKDVDVTYM